MIKATSILLMINLLIIPMSVKADSLKHEQKFITSPGFYYSHETSNLDTFSAIGFGAYFVDKQSRLGAHLSTSLGKANVLTDLGTSEDFLAWEGHLKLGYFSDFSLYGEFGIDIGELLDPDFRQVDEIIFNLLVQSSEYQSEGRNVDSYIGIGTGFQLGNFNVSAFSRLRNIDTEYWQAKNEVFHGIQFSINF